MSISINLVQRKDKSNQNGAAPIHIRFIHKGKSRYVSTGVVIPVTAWNAENQTISTEYANAAELQVQINSKLNEYQKQINRLEILDIEVNFDTLLGQKSKKINCTVEQFFQQQIELMKKLGKVGTASKYETCLSMLKKCNPVNIRFEQVDLQYLRDFEAFLIEKGNASNSIATKFSVLKAVYNKAISDEVFQPKENPFLRFKVGKYWKPTRKRAITKEDVLKIKSLELPKNDFYLSFARDIFMFSYYVAGINIKDIATLRFCDIQNGRIYYQRHKTGKEMNCQIIPESQQIMDRYAKSPADDKDYIFPILDRKVHTTEQQIYNRVHKVLGHINKNLEILGKMAGLKTHLTTYVARHTYATVMKRAGVNIALISESLGHSDLSTTQIYLDSFENTQIDQAMQNLL